MRKSCVVIFLSLCLLYVINCEKVTYHDFDVPEGTENYSSNKKVLLIGIDGCRADVLTSKIAPTINGFLEDSNTVYALNALAEAITVSGPNWTSMLTGVHYQKHNVIDNDFGAPRIGNYPNVFYHLEAKYKDIRTASLVNWSPINDLIVRNTADEKFRGSDEQIKNKAVEILKNQQDIDLLFVAFDDVDGAGHQNGFLPEVKAYTDVVTRTDEYIASIIDALKNRPSYEEENWLIVFTTDHGGNADGHGGGANIPEIRNIFTIYQNDFFSKKIIDDNPSITDVAVTILDYLGVDVSDLNVDGEVRN